MGMRADTGWQTDGKMFDSSVTRGQKATFPLARRPFLEKSNPSEWGRRANRRVCVTCV